MFVLRLRKVHSEAMRQPTDLQKRLLVCGLKWRRKHHKLLQHSWSVQLQWSQGHSHAHTPAAVDCRGVIYAVTLKMAPLSFMFGMWDLFILWTEVLTMCGYSDVNLSLHVRRFFKNKWTPGNFILTFISLFSFYLTRWPISPRRQNKNQCLLVRDLYIHQWYTPV